MRFLSGIKPTGIMHLGNYIGAISQFTEFQNESEAFVMLADYHSITVAFDPKELNENILNSAATYIASGLDPEKSVIFQQSQVVEHTELAWVLMCLTKMGEAERMTQFKDKSGDNAERVSTGLFTYPMLMAADILLYDPDFVPVGHDQKQHLELARDLAGRFNHQFGETFVVPEPRIKKTGARIMGLDDPLKKMSKSAASAKNYIALTDDDKTITKKIKSAVTDSIGTIEYVPETRPGISNLVTIYSEITGVNPEAIVAQHKDSGYGDFKGALAEAMVEFISPIRTRHAELLSDKGELTRILKEGSDRAREMASKKMVDVREKLGLSL